jgi:hypothetical protein
MKKILSLLIILAAFSCNADGKDSPIKERHGNFAQLAAPKLALQHVYTTKLTASWTKPANAVTFTLQRSDNTEFAGAVTLLSGGQQVYVDASLVGNTTYYYRVKAEAPGFVDSEWSLLISQTTFWTPSENDPLANPSGRSGNRIANITDVNFYGGNVRVGDFIVVGYSIGSGPGQGGEFGHGVSINSATKAALANDSNHVIFIGGRAYDYVALNMINWAGSDTFHRRIITNSGGQLLVNAFDISNAVNYKLTGKYNTQERTGNINYLGFDNPDWSKLSESFGFYFRGDYDWYSSFALHVQGNSAWGIHEYFEGGEGGYVPISVKNDGYPIRNSVGADQLFSVPNTSGGWQTVTNSSIVIPYESSAVRIFAQYNGGGGANFKVNWIEFENQTTTAVYRIEAESFVGKLRASTESCTDAGGGLDLTGMVEGSAADYNQVIPAGNYTVRARISSTVTTGLLMIRLGSSPYYGFELRKTYLHDSRSGEDGYIGSTQADPQQLFYYLYMHDNLCSRAGLNAFQTGQLDGETNVICNNTFVIAGTSWSNTFQRFQDQTIQQSSRRNGFKWINNIQTGGGDSYINYFMLKQAGLTSTQYTEFGNNAFLNLAGSQGAYINTKEPGNTGGVKLWKNIFGRVINGRFQLLYPGADAKVDYVVNFESSPDPTYVEDGSESSSGNAEMRVGNNLYDFSFNAGSFVHKSGYFNRISVVDSGTNVRQTAVPYLQFNNLMDLDSTYDWSTIETFCTSLSPQWNRYNTPFTNALNSIPMANITIPTTHPTTVSFNVYTEGNSGAGFFNAIEPGRSYTVGEYVVIDEDIYTRGKYFVGQVVSFNATTGAMVVNSVSNVGTGTIVPTGSSRVSRARTYGIGQIVGWNKRFYKSKINNNIASEPSIDGDSKWDLIIFSNGSLKPVDDVRLPANDFYKARGIGMNFNAPVLLLNDPRLNVRRGSRLKFLY